MQQRKPIEPFAGIDVWTPEILEEKAKWENEQREISLTEKERYELQENFDYEPNFYPWCERWTKEEGEIAIDPVLGTQKQYFVLCAYGNPDGKCEFFRSKM